MGLPSVIGLFGYARSGKDAVAAILKEHGYERVALADPVRELALAIDPWVYVGTEFRRLRAVVEDEGWDDAKAHPEVRAVLQRVGTEGCRAVLGEDVWIRTWERRAREVLAAGGRVVCTDVRFPNEAEAIRSMGGVVWRVVRPGVGPVNGHVSDNALDAIEEDRVAYNHGTLAELRTDVEVALRGVSA